MDLATISTVLIPALGAITVIGGYLRGQTRRQRVENRKLRQLVLDGDEWMFEQRRKAARAGLRLDPIPTSWKALHEPDDDATQEPTEVTDAEPGGTPADAGTGRRSRHAAD